jgi:hypothetical protein
VAYVRLDWADSQRACSGWSSRPEDGCNRARLDGVAGWRACAVEFTGSNRLVFVLSDQFMTSPKQILTSIVYHSD